ncbi:MAG: ribonuclease PH, partial [Candidatus Omnitrophota bacterium]
ADVDMNVVMLGRGDFVEVQGTAERAPFSKAQTDQMLTLAKQGIQGLIKIQKGQLGMRLS